MEMEKNCIDLNSIVFKLKLRGLWGGGVDIGWLGIRQGTIIFVYHNSLLYTPILKIVVLFFSYRCLSHLQLCPQFLTVFIVFIHTGRQLSYSVLEFTIKTVRNCGMTCKIRQTVYMTCVCVKEKKTIFLYIINVHLTFWRLLAWSSINGLNPSFIWN